MNIDQQTADAKLREAADKAIPMYEGCEAMIEHDRNIFIQAIKSEAAKEYWQSQQSVEKVYVEMLRSDFVQYAWNNGKGLTADKIFDWFLSYLQPAKEESDTAEMDTNIIESIIEKHIYPSTLDENDQLIGIRSAAEAIYAEFETTIKKA